MKKGDLVKRCRDTGESFHNDVSVGSTGVILRGPYEKNISDIIRKEKPWLFDKVKINFIKRVIDVLHEDKVYYYCLADEYERVRN